MLYLHDDRVIRDGRSQGSILHRREKATNGLAELQGKVIISWLAPVAELAYAVG
jgi:hypothetical protein